jgi:hypothetical protein
MGGP